MCGRLDSYLISFATLPVPRDKNRWSEASSFRSPEAPFLLLAFSNQIAAGTQHRPFISPTTELRGAFNTLFNLYSSSDKHPDIAQAFILLGKTSFCQLRPKAKIARSQLKYIETIEQLRTHFFGAEIDQDLFNLLQMKHSRDRLNFHLIKNVFSKDLQSNLQKALL